MLAAFLLLFFGLRKSPVRYLSTFNAHTCKLFLFFDTTTHLVVSKFGVLLKYEPICAEFQPVHLNESYTTKRKGKELVI